MTRHIIPAAILALSVAAPALADQFAVRLNTAYDGASAPLMETLRISEVARFSEEGAHFVVLEAPNDAYVEAFVHAIGRDALELHALDADWAHPVVQGLPVSQRLGLLRAIACDFCTS